MPWPLSQDYNEAIQDPRNNFSDAELKTGEAVANALGIPMPRSGNFADVYEVRCPSGSRWAVKCFTREVFGLGERYAEIGKYLRLAKLPFMVDFQYLEQGIRVRGQWYPILKMQWVEGFLLNEFVRDNLDKKPILQGLGQIWLKMARRLRESYIAHCDLQHGNVLFVPGSSASSLAVKLIDYDGMCVPSLVGTKSGEVGHPAYQHPERLRTGAYDQEVDRFSLLSIAAALRCLAIGGRSLWERYDTGDNLLFRQADFQAPKESPLFQELLKIGDEQARMLVTELHRACQGPLDAVPLLTDLVPEEKPAAPAPSRGKVQPATRTAAPAATQPNAFENIEPTSSGGRARRKAERTKGGSVVPWIAAGGVAACALVGGVLFWAMRSPSPSENKPAASSRQQARVDKVTPGRQQDNPKERQPSEQLPPVDPPPAKPSEDKPAELENKHPKAAATAIPLLDGPPGEVRRFEGHTAEINRVAFSKDGRLALSGGGDGTVRLWDLTTGKEVKQLSGHQDIVTSVAFSPDRRLALTGAVDKTARVWDVAAGRELVCFRGHNDWVRSVAFSANGKRALTASGGPGNIDCTVRLWDVTNGQEIQTLKGHEKPVTCAVFTPDGSQAVSGSDDGSVRLWNLADGREVRKYVGHQGFVYGVAVAGDSQLLASVGDDKAIRLWDVKGTKEIRRLEGHTDLLKSVAFTPDGRRLLSASHDQTIRLWDVATGTELGRYYGPKDCKMLSVAVSPDGRFFLSGESDKLARLWRLPPPEVLAAKPDAPVGEVLVFKGHSEPVRRVAFSFDGRHVLSGGYDNTARLWETATGREVLTFRKHTHPDVTAVAFLPDGRRALSGGADRMIRLWSLRDGHEARILQGSRQNLFNLAVSRDGKRVASCGLDMELPLWNLETGELTGRLPAAENGSESICFSPDGRSTLVGYLGGALVLWDATTGQKLQQFSGHTGDVMSVGFSPDGQLVLSASRDKTVRLWKRADGTELRRFEGSKDEVAEAALSPDGRRVLAGGNEKILQLWDAATGKELARFEGHTAPIRSVAWSPDGHYALSGSNDKTLRLWRVPFVPFEVGRPLEIKAEEPKVVSKPATPEKIQPAPVAAKLPVPDEAALKKATEEVRDIYKADYASRKADERLVLAGKLLKRGTTKQEEPARRFAYFSEARDLAARGGDAALSLSAIDEMDKVFVVEPLPMKTGALELTAKERRTPEEAKNLLVQTLTIADEAESADDYEQDAKLLKVAQSAALQSRDLSLRSVVTQREKRLLRLRAKYARIANAVKTVADKPKDAEASLTVGKFQCFDKEDWSKGLPLLERGSDSALAELAHKDRAGPEKAAAKVELGHKWWEFAEKQRDEGIKSAVRSRAQRWFHDAFPLLDGDEKVRVESRLERKIRNQKCRPGLIAELFAGQKFERRIKGRLDYNVDFNWGLGRPDPKMPDDHFSIRWQGWLIPPRTGKYKLIVMHDDGVRLILDGKSVIDKWGVADSVISTAEVTLSNQPHALQLDFLEIDGAARIHLHWSLDGGFKEQTVPLDVLYHEVKQERLLAP